MTCGRISASANSRTVRRRSSCSSVGRKSTGRDYHVGADASRDRLASRTILSRARRRAERKMRYDSAHDRPACPGPFWPSSCCRSASSGDRARRHHRFPRGDDDAVEPACGRLRRRRRACSSSASSSRYAHTNEDLTRAGARAADVHVQRSAADADSDRRACSSTATAGGGVYRETLSTVVDSDRDQLRHQHRRRREDVADRSAAAAAGLPRVHVERESRGTRTCSGCMRDLNLKF